MKEGEDEGGTLALQMSEDLSNKNWADIMQEEQYMAPPMNDSPEREPSPLPGPPYIIQVTCCGATDEEIFFLFGGEETVKWMNIVDGKGKVELHNEDSMRRVLEMNGEVINEGTLTIEIPEVRPSNDVRMVGGISGSGQHHRYDGRHDESYHHRSTQRQDSGEYGRGGYHGGHHDRGFHHSGYGGRGGHMDGTYSRGRGGGGGGYRGRGGYPNDSFHNRGNYRGYGNDVVGRYQNDGGYSRGNYQYGQQRDQRDDRDYQAAPINRSRTESTSSYATLERAPSRFSCDAPISNSQVSVDPQRKPSAKSIFGDAKPVDTSKKLCEVEEKLAAEKERKEKERKEKEAEEKKRLEDEKKEKEDEKKRKDEEKRRIDEEKEKEKEKTAEKVPIQILRRPKVTDSTDGPSPMERIEGGSEEKGEKTEKKKDDMRKKSYRKEDREKEKERENDREKSQPKSLRTFSNSARIGPKSGSVEQEDAVRGGDTRGGRGRGRGNRGRGGRGYGGGGGGGMSGRKNSIGSTIDGSVDREKEDEKREKKEEWREGKEKEKEEKTDKKSFNMHSRLYSDGDTAGTPSTTSTPSTASSHPVPPPSHSTLPPPSKSIPLKDTVHANDTTDSLAKGDSDRTGKKKGKSDEKEETKEEKKVESAKGSTPKKKNKGKGDKGGLKFASNNKFAALLED